MLFIISCFKSFIKVGIDFIVHCGTAGVDKLWLRNQIWPASFCIKSLFLEHSSVHSFATLFCPKMAELSSCNREHLPCKVYWLFTERLMFPAVPHSSSHLLSHHPTHIFSFCLPDFSFQK